MITKIFYSLVLFPAIKYDSDILGYSIFFIEENKFGELKVVFKKGNDKEDIYFTHQDFVTENIVLKTKNWGIYGNNKLLLNKIYKIVLDNDISDFNFFKKDSYYKKLPFGVVLSITSKCNIFCYYCFNDTDYNLKTRNIRKTNGIDYWKEIIDKLYDCGTRVIILTGGEPMITPYFWDLLNYLQKKNIFIHLNTNGTLLTDDNLKKLDDLFSLNIMISMHEFNDEDYYEVNRKGLEKTFGVKTVPEKFKKMFSEKIIQLRKIEKYKNISLEFLTILNWKNIVNLDKIYYFGIKCGIQIHNWQFFRLYSTKNNKGATKSMMNLAINKMYLLNKKYGVNYKIVDPVPFCVTKNINRALEVIDGVLSDTHNVKTIINTDGYIQLMSAYDTNLGNIKNYSINKVFNLEFTKKMLNQGFLPKQCRDCKYKDECKGGSRMDANIVNGGYDKIDPIADINNKCLK